MKEAPVAFWCGGLAGAAWPFAFFYIVSRFTSGTTIGVTGPKNWADQIMGCGMLLSYTGPVALALLFFAMLMGFRMAGYCTAAIMIAIRSRT